MITIPSSIAYFVLGFVSCIARNENKKRQEITNMLIKSFTDKENKSIDEDKAE